MKYYIGSDKGEFVFIAGEASKKKFDMFDKDKHIVIPATPSQIFNTIFRKINIANNIRMWTYSYD